MWTWSVSTSLRSRVSAVAGMPSLSSRMTSSLRPAICQPLSSQNSSQPLYMSLPAWAMAPDSGARKPILIGPWANAAPAASIVIAAIVFRHVWRQLLDLKRESPVDARHFEIAILVVSHVTRCDYCVSHHTPRALGTGLTTAQVEYLATVGGASLDANGTVGQHPGFDGDESLVIDLARFILWAGMRAPAAGVAPRFVHDLRRRLLHRVAPPFSPPHIGALTLGPTQRHAVDLPQ